jgi:hypothetical protein
MIVFNACLFVAAAVSGMRTSELMELTTRSCLPPRQIKQGLFRYSLCSKRIKGEPLGGVVDEWVVIEPACRAVELATRLAGAKSAPGRHGTRHVSFRPLRLHHSVQDVPTLGEQSGGHPTRATFDPRRAGHGTHGAANPGPGTRPSTLRIAGSKSASETYFHCHNRMIFGSPRWFPGPLSRRDGHRRTQTQREARRHSLSRLPERCPGHWPRRTFPHRHIPIHRRGNHQIGGQSAERRGHRSAYRTATQETGSHTAHPACQLLPLAGLCDSARCPQATFHREHREVWAGCVKTTETFLGNPRIPVGEKTRLTAEHQRAQQVLKTIDIATGEGTDRS